jgi:hypothetical protein
VFQKGRIERPNPQRIKPLGPGRVNDLNPLHAVELREAMRYRSKVPQTESGKVGGIAVAYVGSMQVAVTWIDPLALPVCETSPSPHDKADSTTSTVDARA